MSPHKVLDRRSLSFLIPSPVTHPGFYPAPPSVLAARFCSAGGSRCVRTPVEEAFFLTTPGCFSPALTGSVSPVGFPVLTQGLNAGLLVLQLCQSKSAKPICEITASGFIPGKDFPGNIALIWCGGHLICEPFC